MMDANAFLKRILLVAAVGSLPFLSNIALAHSGGHGSGSSGGGSSGGSSSSSSGGHSAASTSSGHSTSASKTGHSKADPPSISQSMVSTQTGRTMVVRRNFVQRTSTGYNSQNIPTENDDWKRRHHGLLFGFIRY